MEMNRACVDTLRLKPLELPLLLAELERREQGREDPAPDAPRRFSYRGAGVLIEINPSDEAGAIFQVAPAELGDEGMTFLHGGYLHVGTRCAAHLPVPGARRVVATGRVQRCFCLRGRVHAVELRFDAPIDASQFLAPVAGETPGAYDPEQVRKAAAEIFALATRRADLSVLRQAAERLARLLPEQTTGTDP